MRIDLRARLALLLGVTVWVITFSHPLWNAVLAGMLLVALIALGAAARGLRALLPVLPVMVLVAGFAVFAPPSRLLDDPDLARLLVAWGPLQARVGGALLAATYLVRMACMVIASWLVVADASLDEVLDLAARWKAPAWLATMLGVAITTIPTLAARREQIMMAQQSRGARVDGNPVRRWTGAVALMVPLITSALASSAGLGIALAVRGHGAHRSQTAMRNLHGTAGSAVVAVGSVLVAVLAVVLRVGFGLGGL